MNTLNQLTLEQVETLALRMLPKLPEFGEEAMNPFVPVYVRLMRRFLELNEAKMATKH